MAEQVFFSDSAPLDGVRITRDGYMVATVKAGRTGIQVYGGAELDRSDLAQVRIYRPEDEVFASEAMHSAAHRPATIDHPSEFVTADNWKDLAVGTTGGEVMRDGGYLSVPLVLMDGGAIKAVRDGKRELSWGYGCEIDWTAGKTADGEEYDAVQRNIRINHLAVVDRGRAGPECRIGDAARRAAADASPPTPTPPKPNGGRTMADDTNQRAVVLDGLTVRTNDAGAEAIARLQNQLRDAAASTAAVETRLRDAEAAHRTALDAANGQVAALRQQMQQAVEAKDGEIAGLTAGHAAALAAKDGEIAALQAQTADAALDARVAARSALLAQVRPILGDAFSAAGLSDAAIRKAAVVKAMGAALTDADSKGDAFFDGAFTAVVAQAQRAPAQAPAVDLLRQAIATGAAQAQDSDPRRTAHQEYVHFLENAHRAGKEG